MLKVRITLHKATTGETEEIGLINIANTGEGTPKIGKYRAVLFTKGNKPRIWKTALVEGFPRTRLQAYDLLYRVLRETVGGRNKDGFEEPWLLDNPKEQYLTGWKAGAANEPLPISPTDHFLNGHTNGRKHLAEAMDYAENSYLSSPVPSQSI